MTGNDGVARSAGAQIRVDNWALRLHGLGSMARLGLAVAALLLVMLPAAAADRYAAMLVDASTGQVLHAEAADAPRYPASLTKVMTLYMVFEQIELGRLKPDTRIRISPEASSVAPSRLGLEPGTTIAVADAVKALITKSANDIAVALAEHISGDEARFAEAMTRKARELGMRQTTFRNAHGLPDAAQVTTARDMLTLALRLYDTFPAQARLFSLRSFHYAGRTHRNHNTMLASFAGMDGIKTGYTRASGFNLLASVRRDGRHVVAVVLGGSSASARNARMRLVLNRGLQRASTERTRRPLVVAHRPLTAPALVARPSPVVTPRQVVTIPVRPTRLVEPIAAVSPAEATSGSAPRPASRNWRSEVRIAAPFVPGSRVASRLATVEGWQPATAPGARGGRPPSTLAAQAARLASQPTVSDASSGQVPGGDTVAAAIQIGAFNAAAEALDRLEAARRLSPALLAGVAGATPAVRINGRTLYRARFVGLDPGKAAMACTELRRRKMDCLVTRAD